MAPAPRSRKVSTIGHTGRMATWIPMACEGMATLTPRQTAQWRAERQRFIANEERERRATRVAASEPAPRPMGRRLALMFLYELAGTGVLDRLVRGLLGENVFAVIYGESGSGKSFAAFDLGMHVALGWPWMGHKVTAGGVLYVAAEGAGGWRNRVEAFCRHHGIKDRERVPFAFILASVNLGREGGDVPAVVAAAKELEAHADEPVRLVIIDTLARAMPDGNENDPLDMGRFVAKCDAIREQTGATVLVVHHAGKNPAAGARGHSALRAATDTELEVERRNGDRLVRVTKSRDGQDGTTIGFALALVEVGRDEDGDAITSCVVEAADGADNAAKPTAKAKWQLALDVLDNTLADHPEENPNPRRYPTAHTFAKVERFREALRDAGIIDGESGSSTERMQWLRLKDDLIKRGYLRIHKSLCWRVTDASASHDVTV